MAVQLATMGHNFQLTLDTSDRPLKMHKTTAVIPYWQALFCLQSCPAGHIFLHRLINLSCSVSKLHHTLSITV